jgi:hypothetical protein
VLSAKVLWPLFPLLLSVVIVSLTWALVHAVRHAGGATAVWLQCPARLARFTKGVVTWETRSRR